MYSTPGFEAKSLPTCLLETVIHSYTPRCPPPPPEANPGHSDANDSLRYQKLPVHVPPGARKYPKEWCMNGSGDCINVKIPEFEIQQMMRSLRPFVPLVKYDLEYLSETLADDWVIYCDDFSFESCDLYRILKFGHKTDAARQEAALRLVEERASKICNLTLGDVKALLYITTLESDLYHSCIGSKEEELAHLKGWTEALDELASVPDRRNVQGFRIRQWVPILQRPIELYDEKVIPEWCYH